MKFLNLFRRMIPVALLAWCGQSAMAQVQINGTVYDRTQRFGMQGVSVMGTSGAGTMTDSTGHYSIRLSSGDSIYFSYLGKFTARWPIKMLDPDQPFNMSLEVGIDSLPPVIVQSRNYLLDSLRTREEYQKVFDYEKSYLTAPPGGQGMGFGVDFDMLLNPAKARRMEAFRDRLIWEEQNNYIDHRFSPGLVRKITGLEPPALDSFMKFYRPSYEFLQTMTTEYEFYKYISDCAKFYSANP
jgi:hypothetical protein